MTTAQDGRSHWRRRATARLSPRPDAPGHRRARARRRLKADPRTMRADHHAHREGRESDAVIGLSQGADDYVRKPSAKELVARIGARLRSARGEQPLASTGKATFGDLVDPVAEVLLERAGPAHADRVQALHFLVSNRGRAFTRNQLLNAVVGQARSSSTGTSTCTSRRSGGSSGIRAEHPHDPRPRLQVPRGSAAKTGPCARHPFRADPRALAAIFVFPPRRRSSARSRSAPSQAEIETQPERPTPPRPSRDLLVGARTLSSAPTSPISEGDGTASHRDPTDGTVLVDSEAPLPLANHADPSQMAAREGEGIATRHSATTGEDVPRAPPRRGGARSGSSGPRPSSWSWSGRSRRCARTSLRAASSRCSSDSASYGLARWIAKPLEEMARARSR